MKFSKRSLRLQSFTSYIGFHSPAHTATGYEIRARQVERARVSGSFTWTPLDELLELADIPELIEIIEKSMVPYSAMVGDKKIVA